MSPESQQPDYSIWSFCFAKGKLPRDFIEGSPVGSNQGLLDVPMVYSVIATAPSAGKRKVFAVDTGFATGRSMTGRVFADFEKPDAILSKIELTPADVDTILLTHLHFDHAGNIDAFPNANILLQRSEYDGWKRVLKLIGDQPTDKRNWMLSSMNLDDIVCLDRAIAAGRVTFIDGSHELLPGLSVHLATDTHTFGCQWVEATTPEGPYVVASDTVVSYSNLERMWPPGYHQGNCWNLLQSYDQIKAVVGAHGIERIVPGHDMQLFERLPHWVVAQNPVAEVHIARGQRSFAEGATRQAPSVGVAVEP